MATRRQKPSLGMILGVASLAALMSGGVAWGEDTQASLSEHAARVLKGETASAAGSSPRQQADNTSGAVTNALSNLTIHGYLQQAYATADFASGGLVVPSADEVALGIPEDGTFSYRNVALQFRYDITPRDVMVVQLSNRALGESPVEDIEDEVELDWAFYERKLADYTSVKVGRVQIPLGIYNEVRDVGVILPQFRPAFTFYREGTFTNETVDGILLQHTFAPLSDWSLEASAYFGDWELLELDPFTAGGQFVVAKAKDSYGAQLWLNSPWGVRFGLGGQVRELSGGLEGLVRPVDGTTEFDDIYASIDAPIGNRFVVRAEWRLSDAPPDDAFFGGEFETYYIQLGINLTSKLRLFLQTEYQEARQDRTDFIRPLGLPATEDTEAVLREEYSVALNYTIAPHLVLKLEHHFDIRNEDLTFVPVFDPSLGPAPPVALQPQYFENDDGEYTILSIATAF
ncbi:MAG: hypothetical protein AAF968_21265 [Pseudomonadota bacterium]